MKKQLLTLLLMAGSLWAAAQGSDTPAFKKNPILPPISLVQVDSSILTVDMLKHQPTLVMVFSPSCDHCKHQWEDMVKHKDQLKNIQIVMATFQPFEEMEEFYKTEKVASYPNIKMGRDEKFTLLSFYRMTQLPFQALYDKKGKLITSFESNVPVDKVLAAFAAK